MTANIQYLFFFFNDTATTEIYTLSLHDALPIYLDRKHAAIGAAIAVLGDGAAERVVEARSEEHTSELQSQSNLVCRLLLEKKNKHYRTQRSSYTTTECSLTTL